MTIKDSDIFNYTSDTVFGDVIPTRYNIGRYVFSFFNDSINWKLIKQKTVITFNIEVELLALTDAVKEIYCWK